MTTTSVSKFKQPEADCAVRLNSAAVIRNKVQVLEEYASSIKFKVADRLIEITRDPGPVECCTPDPPFETCGKLFNDLEKGLREIRLNLDGISEVLDRLEV